MQTVATKTRALIRVEAACVSKKPQFKNLPQWGPPYWMMYRGSNVGQLPRQGVCEVSISALGGGPSSSIHANDDNGMETQISRFANRLVGLKTRYKPFGEPLFLGEAGESPLPSPRGVAVVGLRGDVSFSPARVRVIFFTANSWVMDLWPLMDVWRVTGI